MTFAVFDDHEEHEVLNTINAKLQGSVGEQGHPIDVGGGRPDRAGALPIFSCILPFLVTSWSKTTEKW